MAWRAVTGSVGSFKITSTSRRSRMHVAPQRDWVAASFILSPFYEPGKENWLLGECSTCVLRRASRFLVLISDAGRPISIPTVSVNWCPIYSGSIKHWLAYWLTIGSHCIDSICVWVACTTSRTYIEVETVAYFKSNWLTHSLWHMLYSISSVRTFWAFEAIRIFENFTRALKDKG